MEEITTEKGDKNGNNHCSDHNCRRGCKYTDEEKTALAIVTLSETILSERLNFARISKTAAKVIPGRTAQGLVILCKSLLTQAATEKTPCGLTDQEKKLFINIAKIWTRLKGIQKNAFVFNIQDVKESNQEFNDDSISLNMSIQGFNEDENVAGEIEMPQDEESEVTQAEEELEEDDHDAVAQDGKEAGDNENYSGKNMELASKNDQNENNTGENIELARNHDSELDCNDDEGFEDQDINYHRVHNDDHDYLGGDGFEETVSANESSCDNEDSAVIESNGCEVEDTNEKFSGDEVENNADEESSNQKIDDVGKEANSGDELHVGEEMCDPEVVKKLLNDLGGCENGGEKIIDAEIGNILEGLDGQNGERDEDEVRKSPEVEDHEDQDTRDINGVSVKDPNKCQVTDLDENINEEHSNDIKRTSNEEANGNEDKAINDADGDLNITSEETNSVNKTGNSNESEEKEALNNHKEIYSDANEESNKNHEALDRSDKDNDDFGEIVFEDIKPNIYVLSNADKKSSDGPKEVITINLDSEEEAMDEDCKVVYQNPIVTVTIGSEDESAPAPPPLKKRRKRRKNYKPKELKVEIIQGEENCESYMPAFPIEKPLNNSVFSKLSELIPSENSAFSKPKEKVWQPWTPE